MSGRPAYIGLPLHALHIWSHIRKKLEQLERLRSEDTPDAPSLPHTIDQFILNPKSILMTSSYQIPSQNKVKAEKLENLQKIEILEFCYKLNTRHTF